jgi:Ser/Thr protein kinase RdoA (MazF antagonist)
VWRAITWIEGRSFDRVTGPDQARAGAELVGRFHRAVSDLEHDFHFTRAGVHDTAAHLERLRRARARENAPWTTEASELRAEILDAASALPTLPATPARICHGDLKISNLLFDDAGRGLCLIDLDTLGPQTIAFELGDALRSWANPSGEDIAAPRVDLEIVAAAAEGYARGAAGLLSRAEIESVIPGLETVCIELAARFCVDAYDDLYFGWDATRFSSRREHNLVRARGQLALGRSVTAKRAELQRRWCATF